MQMIIDKTNYNTASPKAVVEAHAAGELQVPLTAFSVLSLLQMVGEVTELLGARKPLRKRVEALEQMVALLKAAVEQQAR